jgi:F420-non-reducing hydrogenase iron-sulfur subunit
MSENEHKPNTRILILATLSGGYRGADSAGQSHLEYAPNTYILPIRTAAIFPPRFYLDAFKRGIDAIIVMYSGTDSPFKGDSERTAQNVNEAYTLMKAQGIDTRRLRLTAICTVCVRPFLTEIREMNALLHQIGPVSEKEGVQGRSPAGGSGVVPDSLPNVLAEGVQGFSPAGGSGVSSEVSPLPNLLPEVALSPGQRLIADS